ncbi:hypothetical protein AMTR_s00082p00137310 [Amborella trichopoda]|uniref:Uncharacterized protein n=1 Tax=Amborella trichopoda TaxID=13333 RepID=W1NST0_AMBTC|nr:hypothetical protein AMTR_s00082p00137310 [Amborella trichopoda]
MQLLNIVASLAGYNYRDLYFTAYIVLGYTYSLRLRTRYSVEIEMPKAQDRRLQKVGIGFPNT